MSCHHSSDVLFLNYHTHTSANLIFSIIDSSVVHTTIFQKKKKKLCTNTYRHIAVSQFTLA
jgi:hypothetical protein